MIDDNITKHLQLIQAVVTRLAQNSFAIKSWAVALVSAIFVLATREAGMRYFGIALLPALSLWGLDAYYLRQERLFRKLYDSVRRGEIPDKDPDPFSMDTSRHVSHVPTWWATCWSKTVAWLYGPITILILLLIAFAEIEL